MTGDLTLDVSLVAALVGIVLTVGYALGRRVRRKEVARAVHDAVARTVVDEIHTTRQAATRLPPTVSLRDAIVISLREGCTIAEAGDQLYRQRVKALVDQHLRHGAPR
jgi:hypothetical protein